MNYNKTKRDQLVVVLKDGTRVKLDRYGKRKGFKNLSDTVRRIFDIVLGGEKA